MSFIAILFYINIIYFNNYTNFILCIKGKHIFKKNASNIIKSDKTLLYF